MIIHTFKNFFLITNWTLNTCYEMTKEAIIFHLQYIRRLSRKKLNKLPGDPY